MNFDSSELDVYFEKKYAFHHEKDWNLPSIDLLHKDNSWNLEAFMEMKIKLNNAKSSLDDKGEDWQDHTTRINKAGSVISTLKSKIQTELLTQAWCKFYEILGNYNIISEVDYTYKSLHLCEAPGAFICAINHYISANNLRITWNWCANTLNPYYENHVVKNVVVDDRLLFPTLKNWHFGKDNTGDVTEPSYLKEFDSVLDERGQFHLVTADGSINCIENPGEQETLVSELHFCEMLIALKSLTPGGTFVLKKFTFFECITICKMYFLNCVFNEVHVFKPFTSKPGNSEVYVICKGYLGTKELAKYLESLNLTYVSKRNKALFPLSSIPQSFITQLQACATMFMDLQIDSINENLRMFQTQASNYQDELEHVQKLCARKYLEKYKVTSSKNVPKLCTSGFRAVTSFYHQSYRRCKTIYFQALADTYENLTKSKDMGWMDLLNDVDRRLGLCFPSTLKRPRDRPEWHYPSSEALTRMRTLNFKDWILTGKKIDKIQNSKFCNPLLLHLWTRVSYQSQLKFENHITKTCCYWGIEDLIKELTGSNVVEDVSIISLSRFEDKEQENNPSFVELKQKFHNLYEYSIPDIEKGDIKLPHEKKIIYIDTTMWESSLNPELKIRHELIKYLICILKFLQQGDGLLICLQSAMTRFTVGILFMLHTLFQKYVCTHPKKLAPTACGQLWVFVNHRELGFKSKILEHLEAIQCVQNPESYEVLETVPIYYLCANYFYDYMLNENNDHLIRRIRSLISIEKSIEKKSASKSS